MIKKTMPVVIRVLGILVERGSMSIQPRCHGASPISGCPFLRTPRVEEEASPQSRSTKVIQIIPARHLKQCRGSGRAMCYNVVADDVQDLKKPLTVLT